MTCPSYLNNFSVKKSRNTQLCLSKLVIHEDPLPNPVLTVGGVDVSYVCDLALGQSWFWIIEVLNFWNQPLRSALWMPYVPTLLSFREVPPAVADIRKLKIQPDVF